MLSVHKSVLDLDSHVQVGKIIGEHELPASSVRDAEVFHADTLIIQCIIN